MPFCPHCGTENSKKHNFCPNCGTRQGGHDPEDDYRQAEKYFHGEGVPKDFSEAARLFRKAAEQGHAYAQYRLGIMYC